MPRHIRVAPSAAKLEPINPIAGNLLSCRDYGTVMNERFVRVVVWSVVGAMVLSVVISLFSFFR